ncbi:MAG: hypothetical protein ABFS12_13340 [Bacteroidota bacterium]
MKNLMNLLAVLLVLALFATTTFAQQNPDGKGVKRNEVKSQWVDADGDGICDNYDLKNQEAQKAMTRNKKNLRNKVGDGTGSGNGSGDGSALRPQDGTGFGKQLGDGTGTGECDGNGPQGNVKRGGK